MDWKWLLTSFSGRINRQPYWMATLVMIGAGIVLLLLAFLLTVVATPAGFVVALMFLPFIWVGLAVAAKRLHDRDKSAWWLLAFYLLPGVLDSIGRSSGSLGLIFSVASLAVSIWALVELGFLRGTDGPNRFGPDPLAAEARGYA